MLDLATILKINNMFLAHKDMVGNSLEAFEQFAPLADKEYAHGYLDGIEFAIDMLNIYADIATELQTLIDM